MLHVFQALSKRLCLHRLKKNQHSWHLYTWKLNFCTRPSEPEIYSTKSFYTYVWTMVLLSPKVIRGNWKEASGVRSYNFNRLLDSNLNKIETRHKANALENCCIFLMHNYFFLWILWITKPWPRWSLWLAQQQITLSFRIYMVNALSTEHGIHEHNYDLVLIWVKCTQPFLDYHVTKNSKQLLIETLKRKKKKGKFFSVMILPNTRNWWQHSCREQWWCFTKIFLLLKE